ncbi:unnamed protein product, partial [Mesorhabditis spiculigera]
MISVFVRQLFPFLTALKSARNALQIRSTFGTPTTLLVHRSTFASDNRMAVPACCCMFHNNVRHLVLLLATLCISMLFANIVIFGLTSVVHSRELSGGLRTVEQLENLHPGPGRRRRTLNETDIGEEAEAEGGNGSETLLQNILDDNSTVPSAITTTVLQTTTTQQPTTEPSSTSTEAISTKERFERSTAEEPTPTQPGKPKLYSKAGKYLMPLPFDGDVYDPNITQYKRFPTDYERDKWRYNQTQNIQRRFIYSAPGIAILVGTLPARSAIDKWGAWPVMVTSMVISAIFTALTPPAIPLGFLPIFICRLGVGLGFACVMPIIGNITANWGTLKDQASFIATMFLFVPLGTIFSWNWTIFFVSSLIRIDEVMKIVYWAQAGFTLLLALTFAVFYREKPQLHPWVNGIELNRIVAGKVQELKNNRLLDEPLWTLLHSFSAWAIWLAMIGFFWIICMYVTFLPTFYGNTDIFLVDLIGLYGCLPFFGMLICHFIAYFVHRSNCCSSTWQVRIWNSVAFVGAGFMMVAVPYIFLNYRGEASQTIRLWTMFFSIAPLGFTMAGALRSATLVGRFYAQHILALCGVSMGFAFTCAPPAALHFLQFNRLQEWVGFFFTCSGVILAGGAVFAIFGRGSSAGWAEQSWDPAQARRAKDLVLIDEDSAECGLIEMRVVNREGIYGSTL